LARPTCSTGPVLKIQRRGAIISEISEALRTFREFDCLWRATTRVNLLFTLHTRLVYVLKSRGNAAPELRTAMQQVVDGSLNERISRRDRKAVHGGRENGDRGLFRPSALATGKERLARSSPIPWHRTKCTG
jgi:hypothetical protein